MQSFHFFNGGSCLYVDIDMSIACISKGDELQYTVIFKVEETLVKTTTDRVHYLLANCEIQVDTLMANEKTRYITQQQGH